MFTSCRRFHCNSLVHHMFDCIAFGAGLNDLWLVVPLRPDFWSTFVFCGIMAGMLACADATNCAWSHCIMTVSSPQSVFRDLSYYFQIKFPPHSQTRGTESTWVDLDIPCCFVRILFQGCTFFVGTSSAPLHFCTIWFTSCIFTLWYSQTQSFQADHLLWRW